MRRLAIVLVAVLGLGLTACGGGDRGGTGGTDGTDSTGGTGCEDLTSGATFTLTISGSAFHPDCFTAKASQGITIVNEDSATHSFTISGSQVDVTIDAGQTFNGEPVTGVLEPGTYDFFCRFHPSMTGTITVE